MEIGLKYTYMKAKTTPEKFRESTTATAYFYFYTKFSHLVCFGFYWRLMEQTN